MESYLTKVKKPNDEVKTNKKKKTQHEEVIVAKDYKKEEKEYYSENKSFFQKALDFIAGTPEDKVEKDEKSEEKAEQMKDEKELEDYSKNTGKKEQTQKRVGLFASVKSWFSSEEGEDTKEDKKDDAPLISEDIKAVLKIQNKWLLRLPEKTIKEFKNSEDYKIYRETLKKYNLIKVKEE